MSPANYVAILFNPHAKIRRIKMENKIYPWLKITRL
jgi:hypothetical protein